VGKPRGWRPLEDLGPYGWITLKWMFKAYTDHSNESRRTNWKKLTTEQPIGLYPV
jgi:hypothetical protein